MSKIEEYISNSEKLGRVEADELESLREKYMYFQVLHILIAKSHKNQNTFGFNKNLRIASMYAGDRRILYDFINKESNKIEEEIAETLETAEPIPELKEEFVFEKTEKPIFEPVEPKNIQNNEISEVLTDENISTESLSVADLVEETVIIENPSENSENIVEEEEKTEQEIVEKEEEIEINFEQNETDIEIDIVSESQPEVPEISEALQEEKIEIDKTIDSTSEMSFFDWLDKFETPEIQSEKNFENTELEPQENISDEIEQISQEEEQYDPVSWAEIAYEIQAYVKHPEETEQKKSNLSREEVDNILDSFISKNPRISKPKAEFYKPENMARKSEEFHAEVVSETLADLFYKQGLLHKALEMYEKLMLQSPIKKDIFAEKIKNIKEELINKL